MTSLDDRQQHDRITVSDGDAGKDRNDFAGDLDNSAPADTFVPDGRFKTLLRKYGLRFFIVLSAVLLIWKLTSDIRQEALSRQDRAELHERLSEAAKTEILHTLTLTGTLLQAQVRDDMLAGNFYRIKRTFRTLLHDRHVKQLILMRNDGKVLLSTTPQQEGSSYSNMFRNSTAALKEVYVDLSNENVIHVLCPIYRGDDRLGLVIMQYGRTHLSVFE